MMKLGGEAVRAMLRCRFKESGTNRTFNHRRALSPHGRRLPAVAEEVFEQRGGFAFPDAAIDFGPMMAGWSRQESNTALDRAAVGIGRAIVRASAAGKRNGRRARPPGPKCHVESPVDQPFRCDHTGCLADRQQLAMGGRITVGEGAVVRPCDDLSVAHDHAADRHLAGRAAGPRLLEGFRHEGGLEVGHEFSREPTGCAVSRLGRFCYQAIMTAGKGSNEEEPGERIAKVIARAGLASRREAEAFIAAGRVAVNGAVITSPALNVTSEDSIKVDGEPLPQRERPRLFLSHKPRGLVTTQSDPQGRPTIFAALPKNLPRLMSVGRLDMNTEGLLLLTNDGGLARVLELPATGWLRRYRVRALGRIQQARLAELRQGITIDGIRYGSIEAQLEREQGANLWLVFAMREGKNREVKNVLGHLGLAVNRLIRVSFGPFQLGDLPEGTVTEVRTRHLREQLGERITALAGADFSGPITVSASAQEQVAIRKEEARPPRANARPDPRAAKKSRTRDSERLGQPELARMERRRGRRASSGKLRRGKQR